MLVGQQFGPFTIDKELGSGAMGTVYRGRYTKTGQLMAIKIMAPGIGSTNAAAADRFEREIAVLKQLNHPNIVRFYGAGKNQGMRYFAMEFIDGESLDKVMSRRGRMTWEEVVELGKQLCSALQHAHDQGIIHRDLKPSNIMMLPDGTLKLTDFGIAKDIDLEALTATNCTVGTAAYMSPEQCKGISDLTLKSDLYSLGVLFYELVAGRKPFKADNAMDMFMQHVNGTFERPSRLVLDIPVWLDTLIGQLLEKKPEQRPLDANMVANTLGTIQEKVEAQQSAGVEAVRRRLMDRTTSQKRVEEEDKEAARVLMTGKGKVKRKRGKKPLYQKVWFQAAGLSLALVFVATLLYLLFRPPSADKLYQQAKAAAQSENVEEQERAIEPNGAIRKYINLYGDEDNEQAREVRGWRTRIQMAQNERLLNNYMQKRKGPIKVEAQSETEKQAFAAMEADEKGNRDAAVEHWNGVKKLEGPRSSWTLVADKHLVEWNAAEKMDNDFSQKYAGVKSDETELTFLNEREHLAFRAWLAENCKTGVGDNGLAKSLLQSLREDAEKEGGARNRWYLYAAWKIPTLGDEDLNKDKLRDKVQERLGEVRKQLDQGQTTQTKARIVCRDVLILYGQEKALEGVVNEAREFLKEKKE